MRRAYDGRVEADSTSVSELEDVQMSDADTSSSSDGTLSVNTRHTLFNSYGHDRYGGKRKFFRSSLVWDIRNKMAATIDSRDRSDAMVKSGIPRVQSCIPWD